MARTRSAEPRGTTRSMCSSMASRSATASRPSTFWTTSAGPPALTTASRSRSVSARLECRASEPPFISTALPVRSASEPIWITASGRLSKTISRTPIGTRTCSRTRRSSNSRRMSGRPTGSAESISTFTPSRNVSNFEGDSARRLRIGPGRSPAPGASRSRSLAASRSSSRSPSNCSRFRSTSVRISAPSATNER